MTVSVIRRSVKLTSVWFISLTPAKSELIAANRTTWVDEYVHPTVITAMVENARWVDSGFALDSGEPQVPMRKKTGEDGGRF